MKSPFLILLGLCVATTTLASKPLINIGTFNTFFDRPKQVISSDGVARVTYKVTNESSKAKQLFFQVPSGVEIENRDRLREVLPLCSKLPGDGLRPHESCLLPLVAVAAKIRSNGMTSTSGGPYVSTSEEGFNKSRPVAVDELFISVSPLNASVTALALSVNNVYPPFNALTGTPRKITLSIDSGEVRNVTFQFDESFPSDAKFTPEEGICGTITLDNPCTITITPGKTPTSSSSALTVFEDTVTSFSMPIDILSYNSEYQGGYVFSVDDTTPDTQSVGGKVAAKENQAPIFPFGIIWASNGKTDCPKKGAEPYKDCTAYDFISGIDELSKASEDDAFCDGNTNGACDTGKIVEFIQSNYGAATNGFYAADLCTAEMDGYTDWYLPAICELGYYQPAPKTPDIDSGCGTAENPLLQNFASNLNDEVLKTMQGPFWSSTEFSCTDDTCGNAWSHYFTSNTQTHDGKENTLGVRCVRAIT